MTKRIAKGSKPIRQNRPSYRKVRKKGSRRHIHWRPEKIKTKEWEKA